MTLPDPYTTEAAILAAIDAGSLAGTSADLQSLIDSAGGLPAVLPAGVWRIDAPVNVPAGTVIQGAGMTATILYRNPASFASYGSLLSVAGASSGTRISGIGFIGERSGDGTLNANRNTGVLLSETQGFRVHDCFFGQLGFAGVDARAIGGTSHPTGVVHDCLFVRNYKPGTNGTTSNDSPGYGVVVYGTGDACWQGDAGLGGPNAVFVEDCVLVKSRHATAANNGAHMVIRFNKIYDHIVSHPIDAHGGSFGSSRGTRTLEVYGNEIVGPVLTLTGTTFHSGFTTFRGGGGVVFGNTVANWQRCGVRLQIDTATDQDYRAQGYPAQDQVQSLYVWGNGVSGGAPAEPGFTLTVDHLEAHHFRLGRDYFVRPPEGYTPYTYPHPLRGVCAQTVSVPSGPSPVTPAAYTITASSQANGSIYPSGTVSVGAGESPVFVPCPSPGYVVSSLVVDGVATADFGCWRFDGLGWSSVSNFDRWTEKSGNRTIVAKFKAAPTTAKTITASAQTGGSIYPSGAVQVTKGRCQGFAIVPDAGYVISDVLVDGASVGPQPFVELDQVHTDKTIEAVFEAE